MKSPLWGKARFTMFVLLIVYGLFVFGITVEGYEQRSEGFLQKKEYYNMTLDIVGEGYTDPKAGEYVFESGKYVLIKAYPHEGWEVEKWMVNGEPVVPLKDPTVLELYINQNFVVEVHFQSQIYKTRSLTVQKVGQGITTPSEGNHSYRYGESVQLDAVALVGWEFDKWVIDGKDYFESNPVVAMFSNKTAVAHFVSEISLPQNYLTIDIVGQGTTHPSEGTHSYNHNFITFLSASPDEGWGFEKWVIDGVESFDPVTTVKMDRDKLATAYFRELESYTLTVIADGQGTTIPAVGAHTYYEGTEVNLVAVPDDGWAFRRWVIDNFYSYTTPEITITMNSNKTVRAHFEKLPDFWVKGVEFNQAVQSHLGTIEGEVSASNLIAGKDMMVRAYVAGRDNEINPKRVTAALYILKDGSPIDGSPFRPSPEKIMPVLNPSRTVRNWQDIPRESLQFHIPGEAIEAQGTYRFYVVADPDNEVAEADKTNNRFPATGSRSFTLHQKEQLNVLVYFVNVINDADPVNTWDDNGADEQTFLEGAALTGMMFPVPHAEFRVAGTLSWNLDDVTWFGLARRSHDLTRNQGNRALLARMVRNLNAVNSAPHNSVEYHTVVAMLPENTNLRWDDNLIRGIANIGRPGALSRTVEADTLPHEIGHNWLVRNAFDRPDRNHDLTSTGEDGLHVALGQLRIDVPSLMWGGERNRWVSPITYDAFLNNNRLQMISMPAVKEAQNELAETLEISGFVDENNQLGLWPIHTFTIKSREFTPDDPSGDYLLELRDKDEEVLFSLRYHLWDTVEDNSADLAEGDFALTVPRPEDVKYIVFRDIETMETLESVTISDNPPTVRILSPGGGEMVEDAFTIDWEAADPDGDLLTHTILYTHDGNHWSVLASDIDETSYRWDPLHSPGSDSATIKVIVSDGVNTASDRSEIFSVATKAPKALILAPEDGMNSIPGYPLHFWGSGHDLEDGLLSGEQLQWSSDLNGALGTGMTLVTEELSEGTHRITLSVSDSQGNSAEDSISITILDAEEVFQVGLYANPLAGGVVFGDGFFASSEEITVTSTPHEGYEFVNWTEDDHEVSNNSSYTFTVTGDRNLVANFTESETTVPPATPRVTSPVHGEIVHGSSVILEWAPAEGATHYAVWVYNLTKDEQVIYSEPIGETSYTLEALADNGDIYAWSVVASNIDDGTWGDFAIPIAFIDGSDADLLPPTLISPEHHEKVSETQVELQWDAPAGADYYTIWIFNLDTQEALDGYDGTQIFTGTSHTLEGLTDEGDTYAWSISATDSSAGIWSDYAFPRLFISE